MNIYDVLNIMMTNRHVNAFIYRMRFMVTLYGCVKA